MTCQVSVGGATSAIGSIGIDSSAATLKATPSQVSAGASVKLEGASISMVEIHNVAGQLMSRLTFEETDSCTIAAPMTPGLYIITATSGAGRSSTRLLVV